MVFTSVQTHNISAIRPVAQFVVALGSNGRVVDQGSFAEVVEKDAELAAMVFREQESTRSRDTSDVQAGKRDKPSESGKGSLCREFVCSLLPGESVLSPFFLSPE